MLVALLLGGALLNDCAQNRGAPNDRNRVGEGTWHQIALIRALWSKLYEKRAHRVQQWFFSCRLGQTRARPSVDRCADPLSDTTSLWSGLEKPIYGSKPFIQIIDGADPWGVHIRGVGWGSVCRHDRDNWVLRSHATPV